MSNITTTNVKETSLELHPFCTFSTQESHDSITVTEWSNLEGKTVKIETEQGNYCFDLTYGQWDALQVAWNWKESK